MIHLYGLLIGLGVVLIFWLIDLMPLSSKLKEIYSRYYWFILALVLILARFYHLLSNWSFYLNHPGQAIMLWQGGLSIIGGLMGLFLALFYIGRREKISFMALIEPIFLFLPLAQALGRLANFFNQEIVGQPTNLPWGIFLPVKYRPMGYKKYAYFQPVAFYELILDLFLFLFLLAIWPRRRKGQITANYVIFYSLIRILTEKFRLDKDSFYWQGLDINLIFFLVLFGVGLTLLWLASKSAFKKRN